MLCWWTPGFNVDVNPAIFGSCRRAPVRTGLPQPPMALHVCDGKGGATPDAATTLPSSWPSWQHGKAAGSRHRIYRGAEPGASAGSFAARSVAGRGLEDCHQSRVVQCSPSNGVRSAGCGLEHRDRPRRGVAAMVRERKVRISMASKGAAADAAAAYLPPACPRVRGAWAHQARQQATGELVSSRPITIA
jgi:hypothetical protein